MTRYDNKPAKICQIVFSVICFALSAFLIWVLIDYGVTVNSDGWATIWATIGILLISVFTAVAVGILLIPFILITILCRKPWLSVAAYALLVLLEIACFVAMHLLSL